MKKNLITIVIFTLLVVVLGLLGFRVRETLRVRAVCRDPMKHGAEPWGDPSKNRFALGYLVYDCNNFTLEGMN